MSSGQMVGLSEAEDPSIGGMGNHLKIANGPLVISPIYPNAPTLFQSRRGLGMVLQPRVYSGFRFGQATIPSEFSGTDQSGVRVVCR